MMEFEEKLKAVAAPLLAWYDANRRRLPWREEVSPYRTWVSEIMLQQTRVAAVLPYFQRFMERYPTVEALAAGEEQELLKLWEGLGYYSRARNLQKTARIITEEYGGRFPAEYEALTALPGIGDYTAGAIASIAFGEPVPAVDGNVLRILSRVTGSELDVLDASCDLGRATRCVQPGADGSGSRHLPAGRGATMHRVPPCGAVRRPRGGKAGAAACACA